MMGRGGSWTHLGIRFGHAGSNIEMWKTRCTVWRLFRSHRVIEWVPGCARTSYGPRNLSESFLEGQTIWKNWALAKHLASNLEFWARVCWESAGTWNWCWALQCVARVASVVCWGLLTKFMSTCGCEVHAQGEWWGSDDKTLVGKEGCNADSGTLSIVVSELS